MTEPNERDGEMADAAVNAGWVGFQYRRDAVVAGVAAAIAAARAEGRREAIEECAQIAFEIADETGPRAPAPAARILARILALAEPPAVGTVEKGTQP